MNNLFINLNISFHFFFKGRSKNEWFASHELNGFPYVQLVVFWAIGAYYQTFLLSLINCIISIFHYFKVKRRRLFSKVLQSWMGTVTRLPSDTSPHHTQSLCWRVQKPIRISNLCIQWWRTQISGSEQAGPNPTSVIDFHGLGQVIFPNPNSSL